MGNIVALVGFIGSGKDTVGRYLVEEHGFFDMAFADSLKDMCAATFCWDRNLLDGKNPQSREWRDQVDTWWAAKLGIPEFTPRWALQHIGTECLRMHFNDNLWIFNVERRIRNLQERKGADISIVLTDSRFPNELELIKGLGGRTVRVKRGPDPDWFDIARHAKNIRDPSASLAYQRMMATKIHVSEWAWISHDIDETIVNDGSLDELFAQAKHLAG